MTYVELLNALQALDAARMNDTVTVYIQEADEFLQVSDFQIAVESSVDVLDDRHPYLEV